MRTNSRGFRFLIAVILIILLSAAGAVASASEIKAAEGYKAGVNGFVAPLALYDAGGSYAVRTTAKVEVSFAFGSADIALSGSASLFYDKDGYEYVQDMPLVGQSYKFIMELYDNDPKPNSGSVNFSLLNAKNIRLFLDGFEVECVNIELTTSGKVGRKITFRATKLYDAAVRGVKAHVVLYDGNPNYAVGRRGAPEVEYQYGNAQVVMSGSGVLFTVDPREPLAQMPAVGETYTFSLELYNPDPEHTTIDFSMVSTRSVQISMDGWGVACVNVEPCVSGKPGVLLTFQAQKWYNAAVSGVRASFRVINSYPGFATSRTSEPVFSFLYGSSENIELTSSAVIYLEGAEFTDLEKEPEPGKTYTTWAMILYKAGTDVYDVDFSRIQADEIEILIEGYTVTLVDTELTYEGDEPRVRLNLRIVRNDRTVGDANGNRKLEIKDALLILQYLRRQKEIEEINIPNADVNGDKLADIQDARLILQYVCGWDVLLK